MHVDVDIDVPVHDVDIDVIGAYTCALMLKAFGHKNKHRYLDTDDFALTTKVLGSHLCPAQFRPEESI